MVRFDLPWDLVEEILSRVPATSLTRLRFTCKRWNVLLKDEKFITKHMDKAMKQNFVLTFNKFRVYSLSVNLNEIHYNIAFDPSTMFKDKIELTQVFHCNGFLLCSMEQANKIELVVVNPCTSQTRWIEPEVDYSKYDRYALGYANNNKKSYDSLKILKYSNVYKNFGIFELKSNSWRVLATLPPNFDRCFNDRSVSLKGNTYWLSLFTSDILSFDFTTETFRSQHLRFPPPSQNAPFYTSALSVVREEKLSVLRWSHDMVEMEIWVSTDKFDTENVLSWSKSFTFGLVSLFGLRSLTCLSFFIEEEKKVIVLDTCSSRNNYKDMIYILDKQGFRTLNYDTDHPYFFRPFFFSYCPSLVSLFPPL